jgi:hypothetical protein
MRADRQTALASVSPGRTAADALREHPDIHAATFPTGRGEPIDWPGGDPQGASPPYRTSGNMAMSTYLWWFDGLTPPNYPTQVTLYTYPGWSTGTVFTWAITQGADKVQFGNGSSTYTVVDDITAPLVSIAASPPAASMSYDVTITLTINGNYYGFIELSVRTPHSLDHLRDVHQANGSGYLSKTVYRVLDQFDEDLGIDRIGINEKFTSDVVIDYTPPFSYWTPGDEVGRLLNPAGWSDWITSPDSFPVATNPGAGQPPGQMGDDPVDHWNGEWRVGSTDIGQGVLVQRNTWQRFIDHAEHTNIVSPVG